jgi:hypothetical protein
MSNKIKTSGATSKLSATINTNFKIGVDGSDDYGPTSITGFYNGINPPIGGYTIYVHKESGGPSIHVAYDDEQCLYFLKSFGATGTTITEALNWSTGRTDIWVQTEVLTSEDLIPSFTNPTLNIGSAVQIVAQSPFSGGGNSYQFFNANVNSYIDVPASSDWAVGTGDFTIEWFIYHTTNSIPPYQRIFTVDDFPSMDIGVSNEGGTFYYWANNSFRYSSSGAITLNTWNHWAVVRQSGVTKVYRNGVQRGSQITDTNNINNTINRLTIGADNGHATNATFVGYLTNFRWVKGLAVYTGNFTVPTSNLSATSSSNPYGGSNTQSISSGFTKLLLIP